MDLIPSQISQRAPIRIFKNTPLFLELFVSSRVIFCLFIFPFLLYLAGSPQMSATPPLSFPILKYYSGRAVSSVCKRGALAWKLSLQQEPDRKKPNPGAPECIASGHQLCWLPGSFSDHLLSFFSEEPFSFLPEG